MSTNSIKLTYFAIPGRALPIRIAFRMGKVEFEDERIKFPDLAERRGPTGYNAAVPLGSLPIISINGEVHTQSIAMFRWAAKQADLAPTDLMQAFLVDEVMDDVVELYGKAPQDPDKEVKRQKREAYAKDVLPKFFDRLNVLYKKHGGPFLLGKKMTMADVLVFATLHSFKVGDVDYVDGSVFSKYENLVTVYEATKKHPDVKAELSTYDAKFQV